MNIMFASEENHDQWVISQVFPLGHPLFSAKTGKGRVAASS